MARQPIFTVYISTADNSLTLKLELLSTVTQGKTFLQDLDDLTSPNKNLIDKSGILVKVFSQQVLFPLLILQHLQ